MSNAEGLARAAAELALALPGRMAPHAPGRESFQRDYGQGRRTPQVVGARLADDWRGDYPRARSPVGEVGPDRRRDRLSQGARPSLWQQVMAALCPGTRVFIACLAVATFIVVV